MKKYISISLFVFWAVVVSILTAGLVFYNQNKPVASTLLQAVNSQKIPAQKAGASSGVLTSATVAQHSSASDCWLSINGNVYNVTSYLNSHPAGPDTIIPYCGQDATRAFDTKGGQGQPHSARANTLLDNYLVGPLGQ